jgi:DUF1680 family protein
MAYSVEYLKLSNSSYVADELELSFFNGALGSLLGDHDFTYMNDSDGRRESALITLAGHGFEGGRELSCCQANGNRGISMITEWAVLTGRENLYLNYYGSSRAETKTPGGNGIEILQETEYPQNGAVKITLALDKSENFKLNLRIPAWSENTVVRVNGRDAGKVVPGTYHSLDRKWRSGDEIELELDMSVHYWVGEEECAGKSSVYYGPVLLAWNGDLPTGEAVILEESSLQEIIMEEQPDFWLYGRVRTTDGKEVSLVDYSSAGDKGESYTTWLKVAHDLTPPSEAGEKLPIWNSR